MEINVNNYCLHVNSCLQILTSEEFKLFFFVLTTPLGKNWFSCFLKQLEALLKTFICTHCIARVYTESKDF